MPIVLPSALWRVPMNIAINSFLLLVMRNSRWITSDTTLMQQRMGQLPPLTFNKNFLDSFYVRHRSVRRRDQEFGICSRQIAGRGAAHSSLLGTNRKLLCHGLLKGSPSCFRRLIAKGFWHLCKKSVRGDDVEIIPAHTAFKVSDPSFKIV